MSYSEPVVSPNAEYQGSITLPDEGGFSEIGLTFRLRAMPTSDPGASLDGTFQALIDHIAAFPGATGLSASKTYGVTEVVTATEEETTT